MKRKAWSVAVKWIFSGILSIFLILYGILMKRVGSGTGFYRIWFLLAALTLLWRAFKDLGLWKKAPRLFKRFVCSGMIMGTCIVAITWIFIFSAFFTKEEAGLDYLIVLGAQVRSSGPSIVLRYRLDKAYEYLEKNPATKCIVSGGKGDNEPEAEGDAMKRYLVEKGIKADRIIVENASVNTVENIKNSSEYLDKENNKVGIVTNNFHVFRGVSIANKVGFTHVRGIVATSNPFYLPNNMLRESFGIVKDLLVGNM